MMVVLLIFTPIVNEILFRMMFFDRLVVLGTKKAVVISALFYSFPFLFFKGPTLFVYSFVIGLSIGYVRARTKRLLIEINPGVYGYDSIKRTYNIPDIEFDGVHIINQELRSNEVIVEYISSWPSIDTVYVSTTEQAEELQLEYPNIAFIAVE